MSIMITPDVPAPSNAEITQDISSGNGYWYFLPEHAQGVATGLSGVAEYGTFSEIPAIVEEAQTYGSTLVQGAAGSGKSHLVRELLTGCVVNDVPCFCLTMQVNASKPREGLGNAQEQLTDFREAVGDNGGVVILDNIDFLGYKGHSRRAGQSAEYAKGAQEMVAGLLEDPRMTVIGTAHDDIWRQGRWTWDNPDIDEPAKAVLDSFGSRLVFEGRMSLVGLAHILHQRNQVFQAGEVTDPGMRAIDLGTAAKVIRVLRASGRANFFHAQHLDPHLFLSDPKAAIAKIEAGRTMRATKH